MIFIDSKQNQLTHMGEKYYVQMDKLDSQEAFNTLKIDGIKLVAENYDSKILAGAKQLIKRDKPLIYCKLWHNEKRKLTLDTIEQFGYSVFVRDGDHLIPYQQAD